MSRRLIVAMVVFDLIVGAVVAFFVIRSSIEVDRESLARSVARDAGAGFYDPCSRTTGGWRCSVSPGSGSAGYVVAVDGRCWRARRFTRESSTETPMPARVEGCVGLRDAQPGLDPIGPTRSTPGA